LFSRRYGCLIDLAAVDDFCDQLPKQLVDRLTGIEAFQGTTTETDT
jgi:hypothetical protein